MRTTSLGAFENISRLTLGGAGLGQVWGETSPQEAIQTLHTAVGYGVTLIDTAPRYRACETLIAEAFNGKLPQGVRITTKCQIGEAPRGTVAARLEASLDASLKAMRLDHVDIFFLHNLVCEVDEEFSFRSEQRAEYATPWRLYADEVIPAFENLKARGRIGAWGVTGIGVPSTIIKALRHEVKPDAVQAIANLLDSAGAMRVYAEPPRPREIIAEAVDQGVGVLGIRAVQAGALTDAIDRDLKDSHPEAKDFQRAAPFRALCREIGLSPAAVAHRYALDMAGVDTVVLGVKNRNELLECLDAEAAGPLPAELRTRIDALDLMETT